VVFPQCNFTNDFRMGNSPCCEGCCPKKKPVTKDPKPQAKPSPEEEKLLQEPIPEEKTEKKAPVLSKSEKDKLAQILARGNVILVFTDLDGKEVPYDAEDMPDLSEAVLKLKKPIDFQRIHHGTSPVAIYDNVSAANLVIGDVHKVLQIYSTATVVVEGHTATPEKKMDSWSQDLADNRAKRVVDSLKSLGTHSKRLTAEGRPGKSGDGHADVVIQITGF